VLDAAIDVAEVLLLGARLTGVDGVFVEDEQAASGIRVSARTMRDLICGG